MRYLALTAVVAALAAGQYLETTIPFTPGTEPGEPSSIIWNSDDNRLYVGDGSGNRVGVVDGATNAKLASIVSGRGVRAFAYSPVQDRVYAPGEYTDSLTIVDGATGTATYLRASFGGTDICWSPNLDYVYSMASSASRLDVYDCARETLVAQVTLGYTPQHVVCGPTVSKVYVSDWNDENLKVISCATNVVVATIDLEGSGEAVCFSPHDHKAYCALRMDNVVKVVSGASNAIVATVSVPSRPYHMVFNPRDNRIYVACSGAGSVAVIDGATNAVAATIPAGAGAGAIAIDTAANKAWCANYDANTVTVIDCATLQADTTIAVGQGPVAVGYNPVNGRIYVVNQDDASVSVLREGAGALAEERPAPGAERRTPRASLVHGMLRLLDGCTQPVLFDISGRKAMSLKPGPNDVSQLAPGVYFVRRAANGYCVAEKVLLAK
jgi:YVTN family beta-propeller protein